MKSIMHSKDDRTCYVCMMLNHDYSQKLILEEHHVFGGHARRHLSEKFGLKVYLDPAHHRFGQDSVHMNKFVADLVKTNAQKQFKKNFPQYDFREIFGKNYIMSKEDEINEAADINGFELIESEEDDEQSFIDW